VSPVKPQHTLLDIADNVSHYSLSTLTVLLQSVPQLVRPFHPQLTRTMIKSVTDTSSSSVRSKAAAGLGELMKHQVSSFHHLALGNHLLIIAVSFSHVSIPWSLNC
jgi:hypothetical protein